MFSEIPKLTSSTNYPHWSRTITAYLGVQKAWKMVVKEAPAYIKVEGEGDNQAEVNAWEEAAEVAKGVIILTLHPTIAEGINVSKTVPEIWKGIKDKYGVPGPSSIYAKFQKVLATEIPGNVDPTHALEAVKNSFTKMVALNCPVPDKIQVMMVLSKLTHPIYNHITSLTVAAKDFDDVTVPELERLVQIAWEQKMSKKPPPKAAKISAVKPAPQESSFQGQQDKGECPSRKQGHRGGKKKQAAKSAEAEPTSPQSKHAQLVCPIFTPPRPLSDRIAPPPVHSSPALPSSF